MRKAITDTLLTRINAPKTGRLEIFDTVQPGLSVRITPKRQVTFSVTYRIRGQTKKQRQTLGAFPAKGLKEAREEARRALAAAAAGVGPEALANKREIESKAAVDQKRLRYFEAAAEEFLTAYAEARHANPKETRRYFERHLVPVWTGMPLSLISGPMVDAVTAGLLAEGKATAAVRLHGHIRKFFRWAVSRNLVDASPVAGKAPPASLKARERTLSGTELAAIWRAAEALAYPYGTFWQLMYLTGGQRLTDVARMQWDDIAGDVWLIPEPTKSDQPHRVPLSAKALAVLKTVKRQRGPFVFSTTKGRKALVPGSKAKDTLDEKSGVSGWRFHDTRRTVSTVLGDLGEPPHVAEVLQNRKSIVSGVVATYNRSQYETDKARAVKALADYLDAQLAAKVQALPTSKKARHAR